MSAAFWQAVDEREAVVAAVKAEAKRVELERDLFQRIPDAAERVCCGLRWSRDLCGGDPCQVLAGVLG